MSRRRKIIKQQEPTTNAPLDQDSALEEIGSTGLKRSGGFINEEFLKVLDGKKGVETYREMRDNDPIIGAMIFAIQMMIRKVQWRVETQGEGDADMMAVEFLEQQMEDMSMTWEDTISEITSMLPFGWSWHEQVFKRRMGQQDDPNESSAFDDGRIGWAKLPIRAQETLYEWKLREDGEILGMVQIAPPLYDIRFIPANKSLHFRTVTHKNNPEGRSILRNAYRPWYFKKHIENIEGIGIERDLAGLPVALVPPEMLKKTASPETKRSLESIKKIITNIRRDEQEGVIFPKAFNKDGQELYELKLLSTGGQRQFDTDKVIRRKNQEIASVVLADFILLGHEGVGSFALSTDKTNLFMGAVKAWVDSIASIFNRFAVPKLFEFNDFQIDNVPYLVAGEIKDRDLEKLSSYILRLAQSGTLLPDPDLENYLREQADLPQRNVGDSPEEMAEFLASQGGEQAAVENVQQSFAQGKLPQALAVKMMARLKNCSIDKALEFLRNK